MEVDEEDFPGRDFFHDDISYEWESQSISEVEIMSTSPISSSHSKQERDLQDDFDQDILDNMDILKDNDENVIAACKDKEVLSLMSHLDHLRLLYKSEYHYSIQLQNNMYEKHEKVHIQKNVQNENEKTKALQAVLSLTKCISFIQLSTTLQNILKTHIHALQVKVFFCDQDQTLFWNLQNEDDEEAPLIWNNDVGIVGECYEKKCILMIHSSDFNERMNIDMDVFPFSQEEVLVVMPIRKGKEETVLAILEFVIPFFPNQHSDQDDNDVLNTMMKLVLEYTAVLSSQMIDVAWKHAIMQHELQHVSASLTVENEKATFHTIAASENLKMAIVVAQSVLRTVLDMDYSMKLQVFVVDRNNATFWTVSTEHALPQVIPFEKENILFSIYNSEQKIMQKSGDMQELVVGVRGKENGMMAILYIAREEEEFSLAVCDGVTGASMKLAEALQVHCSHWMVDSMRSFREKMLDQIREWLCGNRMPKLVPDNVDVRIEYVKQMVHMVEAQFQELLPPSMYVALLLLNPLTQELMYYSAAAARGIAVNASIAGETLRTGKRIFLAGESIFNHEKFSTADVSHCENTATTYLALPLYNVGPGSDELMLFTELQGSTIGVVVIVDTHVQSSLHSVLDVVEEATNVLSTLLQTWILQAQATFTFPSMHASEMKFIQERLFWWESLLPHSLEAGMVFLAEYLEATYRYERCTLFLVQTPTDDTEVGLWTAVPLEDGRLHRITLLPMEGGIPGQCIQQKGTLTVQIQEKSSWYHPRFDTLTHTVTKSSLCIPIQSENNLLGCFEFANAFDDTLDAEAFAACTLMSVVTSWLPMAAKVHSVENPKNIETNILVPSPKTFDFENMSTLLKALVSCKTNVEIMQIIANQVPPLLHVDVCHLFLVDELEKNSSNVICSDMLWSMKVPSFDQRIEIEVTGKQNMLSTCFRSGKECTGVNENGSALFAPHINLLHDKIATRVLVVPISLPVNFTCTELRRVGVIEIACCTTTDDYSSSTMAIVTSIANVLSSVLQGILVATALQTLSVSIKEERRFTDQEYQDMNIAHIERREYVKKLELLRELTTLSFPNNASPETVIKAINGVLQHHPALDNTSRFLILDTKMNEFWTLFYETYDEKQRISVSTHEGLIGRVFRSKKKVQDVLQRNASENTVVVLTGTPCFTITNEVLGIFESCEYPSCEYTPNDDDFYEAMSAWMGVQYTTAVMQQTQRSLFLSQEKNQFHLKEQLETHDFEMRITKCIMKIVRSLSTATSLPHWLSILYTLFEHNWLSDENITTFFHPLASTVIPWTATVLETSAIVDACILQRRIVAMEKELACPIFALSQEECHLDEVSSTSSVAAVLVLKLTDGTGNLASYEMVLMRIGLAISRSLRTAYDADLIQTSMKFHITKAETFDMEIQRIQQQKMVLDEEKVTFIALLEALQTIVSYSKPSLASLMLAVETLFPTLFTAESTQLFVSEGDSLWTVFGFGKKKISTKRQHRKYFKKKIGVFGKLLSGSTESDTQVLTDGTEAETKWIWKSCEAVTSDPAFHGPLDGYTTKSMALLKIELSDQQDFMGIIHIINPSTLNEPRFAAMISTFLGQWLLLLANQNLQQVAIEEKEAMQLRLEAQERDQMSDLVFWKKRMVDDDTRWRILCSAMTRIQQSALDLLQDHHDVSGQVLSTLLLDLTTQLETVESLHTITWYILAGDPPTLHTTSSTDLVPVSQSAIVDLLTPILEDRAVTWLNIDLHATARAFPEAIPISQHDLIVLPIGVKSIFGCCVVLQRPRTDSKSSENTGPLTSSIKVVEPLLISICTSIENVLHYTETQKKRRMQIHDFKLRVDVQTETVEQLKVKNERYQRLVHHLHEIYGKGVNEHVESMSSVVPAHLVQLCQGCTIAYFLTLSSDGRYLLQPTNDKKVEEPTRVSIRAGMLSHSWENVEKTTIVEDGNIVDELSGEVLRSALYSKVFHREIPFGLLIVFSKSPRQCNGMEALVEEYGMALSIVWQNLQNRKIKEEEQKKEKVFHIEKLHHLSQLERQRVATEQTVVDLKKNIDLFMEKEQRTCALWTAHAELNACTTHAGIVQHVEVCINESRFFERELKCTRIYSVHDRALTLVYTNDPSSLPDGIQSDGSVGMVGYVAREGIIKVFNACDGEYDAYIDGPLPEQDLYILHVLPSSNDEPRLVLVLSATICDMLTFEKELLRWLACVQTTWMQVEAIANQVQETSNLETVVLTQQSRLEVMQLERESIRQHDTRQTRMLVKSIELMQLPTLDEPSACLQNIPALLCDVLGITACVLIVQVAEHAWHHLVFENSKVIVKEESLQHWYTTIEYKCFIRQEMATSTSRMYLPIALPVGGSMGVVSFTQEDDKIWHWTLPFMQHLATFLKRYAKQQSVVDCSTQMTPSHRETTNCPTDVSSLQPYDDLSEKPMTLSRVYVSKESWEQVWQWFPKMTDGWTSWFQYSSQILVELLHCTTVTLYCQDTTCIYTRTANDKKEECHDMIVKAVFADGKTRKVSNLRSDFRYSSRQYAELASSGSLWCFPILEKNNNDEDVLIVVQCTSSTMNFFTKLHDAWIPYLTSALLCTFNACAKEHVKSKAALPLQNAQVANDLIEDDRDRYARLHALTQLFWSCTSMSQLSATVQSEMQSVLACPVQLRLQSDTTTIPMSHAMTVQLLDDKDKHMGVLEMQIGESKNNENHSEKWMHRFAQILSYAVVKIQLKTNLSQHADKTKQVETLLLEKEELERKLEKRKMKLKQARDRLGNDNPSNSSNPSTLSFEKEWQLQQEIKTHGNEMSKLQKSKDKLSKGILKFHHQMQDIKRDLSDQVDRNSQLQAQLQAKDAEAQGTNHGVVHPLPGKEQETQRLDFRLKEIAYRNEKATLTKEVATLTQKVTMLQAQQQHIPTSDGSVLQHKTQFEDSQKELKRMQQQQEKQEREIAEWRMRYEGAQGEVSRVNVALATQTTSLQRAESEKEKLILEMEKMSKRMKALCALEQNEAWTIHPAT